MRDVTPEDGVGDDLCGREGRGLPDESVDGVALQGVGVAVLDDIETSNLRGYLRSPGNEDLGSVGGRSLTVLGPDMKAAQEERQSEREGNIEST